MKDIILADRANCKQVAENIKELWIKNVLYQTGMDLDNCFPENDSEERTIEQKALLRKKLNDNDILILDDYDNGSKIYIQDQLIAEWSKPSFTLKEDISQIDPKKKLYVEITIEYWSVFD